MKSGKKNSVFVLWHNHVIEPGNEDDKLIGVYSSIKTAKDAQKRMSKLAGFRTSKRGFSIEEYEINADHWKEGFATVK